MDSPHYIRHSRFRNKKSEPTIDAPRVSYSILHNDSEGGDWVNLTQINCPQCIHTSHNVLLQSHILGI